MKYLLIIICLIKVNLAFCQETIDIIFNEAQPIWVHTLYDSTFVPVNGQPYFTKYTSLSPLNMVRDKNDLYIMASSLEKQSLNDHGFVLDKLDIKTGEKIWTHHNTSYVGGHRDLYHNYQVIDNKIEMVGAMQDIDQNFYSAHKIIDAHTGKLMKFTKSLNKLPDLYIRYFTGFVIKPDSILLQAYTLGNEIGTIENPIYNYGINAEVYNNEMIQMGSFRNLFDFEELGPFSIDQPNYTFKLNDNNLISLAYKDRYESWDNLGTKIMWTDISDVNNIKTKQIKDYSEIIPGTKESFKLQGFNINYNSIHLSHYYPNFDIQKNTCYILWLDSLGNIKSYLPIAKTENHIYHFANMVYSNNDFAYFFMYPSKTGKNGFDICRIEERKDSLQFVSSVTNDDLSTEFGSQIFGLYEDDILIFGGLVKKQGHQTKSQNRYFCFRASDLGINFKPVSTKNIEKSTNLVKFFPNPVANTLFIKVEDQTKNSSVEIFDLYGKLTLRHILSETYNLIDVSNLTKGVYLVNVINEKGEKIGKTEKMVKVE